MKNDIKAYNAYLKIHKPDQLTELMIRNPGYRELLTSRLPMLPEKSEVMGEGRV